MLAAQERPEVGRRHPLALQRAAHLLPRLIEPLFEVPLAGLGRDVLEKPADHRRRRQLPGGIEAGIETAEADAHEARYRQQVFDRTRQRRRRLRRQAETDEEQRTGQREDLHCGRATGLASGAL